MFVCFISFFAIQQYDGKWNLPLIMWSWLGVVASDGVTRIISGFFVLCWLYLWILIFHRKLKLNAKLIIPFLVLYIGAFYAGYQQIGYYIMVGHVGERALFFIVPFIAFVISTFWLIWTLKGHQV